MNRRPLARLVLGAVAVALGLAPVAVPTAAHAGQVGVTIGITGAGRVEVVEGSIEDGGATACDHTTNLDHRVTRTCGRIRNEELFEAWVWLRPSFFGVPKGWEFVEWQGCDQTRTNSSGTRHCAVHSAITGSVEKFPVAVFRDAEPPEIFGFTSTQVVNEQGRFRFAWSASGAVRSHCQLDNGGWETCTSPRVLTLPEGPHLFAVRAEDASGNLSHSWSHQVHSVDTAFTATPPRLTNSRNANFAFTSAGGNAFDCTLDGYQFTCDNGAGIFSDLIDGEHTLTVAARHGLWVDPVPVRWDWTVDATAPETTLTGGPVEGSATTDPAAEFTLDAPGAVDFHCTLDGALTPCSRGAVRLDGLAPGPHVFTAAGRDQAGNRDPSPATRSWTVTVRDTTVPDTTAPDTTLAGGPEEGSIALTPDADFEVGTTEAGAAPACTLDGADLPCATGPLALTGLAPGTHVLSVRSTDAAGNTDATAATRTWTVPAPASALGARKGWRLKPVAGSYAGTALTAKRRSAVATYAVTDARRLALVVSRGKALGKVKVYAGRRLLRTVSLRGGTATRQLVPVTTFDTGFSGRIRVVVATSGRPVRIEGIAAPTR
ncbi:hypothetical protein [Nocardioides sp. L-11A]|uniref:hypothetical protein n=1 Tax=Nocardioides sp. L-11A TaxID=3043848 RepID=UPI00249B5336|nr:hypothetical protein QJ852_07175 [Nocardioides sp. L-11A]